MKFSNLSEEKLKSKEQELRKVGASLKGRECEEKNGVSAAAASEDSILGLDNPNRQFPHLSDAVQIKYAPNRGRYAVAARDIKIGMWSSVVVVIVE